METEITCRYCQIFDTQTPIIKKNKQFRKCKNIKKLVTYKKTICDSFKMADFFFCEIQGKMILTKTCLYQKQHSGRLEFNFCRRCSQFVNVSDSIDLDSEKKFKRKPLKRRNGNGKLNRRK